jgi:hypothetical protein
MNWIRENKFIAGFLGFVIVAALGLGFLIWQAVGNFGAVDGTYRDQLDQLNALQSQVPFPNQQNLKKYKEQDEDLNTANTALQADLATHEFPLEPMTPEQFQDKLRTAVDEVAEKAKDNKITVPDKFAMGFDRYLTETPNRDAAAPLGRQLTAIEFIINELLDSRIDSISIISRTPLPEESGQKPSKNSVVKHPFEITFVSEQGRFRKVLNDIVSNSKQLYVVRLLQIKNQVDKSPPKVAQNAAGSDDKHLKYIFGAEKLELVMKLEVIDFASPPPPAK